MTNNELKLHGLFLGDSMIKGLELDIIKLKRKVKNQKTKINALESKIKRFEDESKYNDMKLYIDSLERKIKELEGK
ncbi:MAG: hypothetical protein ACRCX5_14315 [Bacteroidales bacterium]|uniref:hypothetical protein n=1 Tax=Clostridium chrysemydis TaxID=2665504 RepID=UPI003F358271